ncbi:MAG TPA: hypothetical protein VG675_23435 [Bryobacteraceae bacterium]|nr:hypothetical protein [Bryobacteraceae bacterium]
MPISVKKDIKPHFGFGDNFALGDTPVFIPLDKPPVRYRDAGGSYLGYMKPVIAQYHWDQFYRSWGVGHIQRDAAKAVSRKFDLPSGLEAAFDELWDFVKQARKFECDKKSDGTISGDLKTAYHLAAQLAKGDSTVKDKTFGRAVQRTDTKFVIFSDFHMTAFDSTLPNYYFDVFHNDQLYLQVLDYYLNTEDGFCLVENGDVEDCLLYVPSLSEAQSRRAAAPPKGGDPEQNPIDYPVMNGADWDDFLQRRYLKRLDSQNNIFNRFPEYYRTVKKFMDKKKYIRLAGNHDSYLDEDHERDLRDNLKKLHGIDVFDALQIKPGGGAIKYLVLHGHQFDGACMQHGQIPFAKSCGEIYTECLSWANQGADRVWTESDTKLWYNHGSFANLLATEKPSNYVNKSHCHDVVPSGAFDLIFDSVEDVKKDSRSFIETLLGAQIGWEYFENCQGESADGGKTDGFNAFTLEVWTGEEMYKLKHMNEVDLCDGYAGEFDEGSEIPTLIVGHTHEPRHEAMYKDSKSGQLQSRKFYMNSGSAGRYENLIWGIEIEGDSAKVISYSNINGTLTKIEWKPQGARLEHANVIPIR